MTTKHTKGPFRATQLNGYNDLEPFFVWSDGINAAVAHVFKRTEQGDDDRDTQAANARLLAAAPDMAEALRNALRHIDCHEALMKASAALEKAGVV
jgi:hypothetical protein